MSNETGRKLPDTLRKSMAKQDATLWYGLLNAFEGTRLWFTPDAAEYGTYVAQYELKNPENAGYYNHNGVYVLDLGCGWGDYTGCDVSRANYIELQEVFGADRFVQIHDAYDCSSLGIILGKRYNSPEDEKSWDDDSLRLLTSMLTRLEDYCLLNEEVHSKLIEDLADESWDNYWSDMRYDFPELDDCDTWVGKYRSDPRDNYDVVREIYFSYEENEWNASTATSVSNNRHEDAVQFVLSTLISSEVPNDAANTVRISGLILDRVLQSSDWRMTINPDTLDLDSPTRCVLGQVFAGYGVGDGYNYVANLLRRAFKPSVRLPYAGNYERAVMERRGFLAGGRWSSHVLEIAWKAELAS